MLVFDKVLVLWFYVCVWFVWFVCNVCRMYLEIMTYVTTRGIYCEIGSFKRRFARVHPYLELFLGVNGRDMCQSVRFRRVFCLQDVSTCPEV